MVCVQPTLQLVLLARREKQDPIYQLDMKLWETMSKENYEVDDCKYSQARDAGRRRCTHGVWNLSSVSLVQLFFFLISPVDA